MVTTASTESSSPSQAEAGAANTTAAAATTSSVIIPSTIILRSPTQPTDVVNRDGGKGGVGEVQSLRPPPLEWLERTWVVTGSTLPMWRKAKNVRIGYKEIVESARLLRHGEYLVLSILPPTSEGGPVRLDDVVSSIPTQKTLLPQPKEVHGIDTAIVGQAGEGWRWAWRGKGLLKIASSKWEVLGYGEKDGEKWVVTFFESSLFTPAGVDIYTDRKGGMEEGLYGEILGALAGIEAGGVGILCRDEMRRVVIDDA